jgi:hypothetical protein
MALTLPDICGNVEFPNVHATGERYVSWCEKYLFNQGYIPSLVVDYSKPQEEWERVRAIAPEMCYKLRCAFLHSGNLELNQRKNDAYPTFRLHISSTEENGIYTDSKLRDDNLAFNQLSLDIRKLAKVLCNAAKEYYNIHEPKEDFEDHDVQVVDVEKEACDFVKAKAKYTQIQAAKKDIKNFEELSESAKIVARRIQNGEQKVIQKELEYDKDLLFALNELIEAGILTIPPNKKKYK